MNGLDQLALDQRAGLPDSLRILLNDYPADGWHADPGFSGLVQFWLDRHMMFRRLLNQLLEDSRACLGNNLDGRRYQDRLSRLGTTLVDELQGHHRIEDAHYFPMLARKDPRIEQGFVILDKDHHALDAELAIFVERANALLNADRDRLSTNAGRFQDHLQNFQTLLARHLVDEEELVVPVILKYGTDGLS